MDLLAGLALRKMQKERERKIGDRGLFTRNAQHKPSPHCSHTGDEAYLKFLKEEQEIQYRRMKKSDHQRVAMMIVYCLLPVLLFLIGFWWRSH